MKLNVQLIKFCAFTVKCLFTAKYKMKKISEHSLKDLIP